MSINLKRHKDSSAIPHHVGESPATVHPASQEWRELGPEDVIQHGDEISGTGAQWNPVKEFRIGSHVRIMGPFRFRRRVEPQPANAAEGDTHKKAKQVVDSFWQDFMGSVYQKHQVVVDIANAFRQQPQCPRCAELEQFTVYVDKTLGWLAPCGFHSSQELIDAAAQVAKERDDLKAKCSELEKRLGASADLSQITADLKSQAAKIEVLETAIRKHRDQKGDDRCWLDDEELYRTLPEGFTPPQRDTAVELELCRKFIQCRHNPATEYVSPQRRIEALEKALREIANHKFLSYEAAEKGIYEGQYGIGVVDGHRACARIANAALAGGKEAK